MTLRPVNDCADCGAKLYISTTSGEIVTRAGDPHGSEHCAAILRARADAVCSAPHTYWVSIGRNVGTEPLTETEWGDFRSDIGATIDTYGRQLSEVTGGRSSWGEIHEDTYLALVEIPADKVERFRTVLGRIAAHYGQDAIGLVGGPGETLVTA